MKGGGTAGRAIVLTRQEWVADRRAMIVQNSGAELE